MADVRTTPLVTEAELKRFRHPTARWWDIKPSERRAVTVEFGNILARQYHAGLTVADIAKFWNKSEHAIRYAMRAAGVQFLPGWVATSNLIAELERRGVQIPHEALKEGQKNG